MITKHIKGAEIMIDVMWRLSDSPHQSQQKLGLDPRHLKFQYRLPFDISKNEDLSHSMLDKYKGKRISFGELYEECISKEQLLVPKSVVKEALTALEDAGAVEVVANRKRKISRTGIYNYPDNASLLFNIEESRNG